MDKREKDVDQALALILKILRNQFQKLPRLQDLRFLEKGVQGCLRDGYKAEVQEDISSRMG